MPYKEIEVIAEVFLTMNDVNIYYSYRDDKFGYRKDGEDVYSFSGYEVDEFDVTDLPLYDIEVESTYKSKEDYHRHLIIASYVRGELESEEFPKFKYADKFANYTADDLGNKLKVYVLFEVGSEWFLNSCIGYVDNPCYKSLVLCNEDDVEIEMLKFPVKDDVDIQQFLEVLFALKGGDIHE
ncbi:hypothetical protein [Bacillus sp. 18-5]|uniref:hypothetical protein n=1 Tax=Bacillus sp. 18-5 TaxID=3458701 RepID=UPI004045E3FA